jgi:hypothetical protein
MSRTSKIYTQWLSGSIYTPEYQAVLDYATLQGYTLPSLAQRIKQNNHIIALKSLGIWDLLDVYYVFATDGDSDFATINQKNPSSFQCTKVNSPTFTANQGFTFNGTTNYLNTNWVPSVDGVNYTLNSAGIFIHENTNVSSNGIAVGMQVSAGVRYSTIIPKSAGTNIGYTVNSNSATTNTLIGAESSIGLTLVNRVSSLNVNAFKNGTQRGVDNAQAVAPGLSTVAPYIGARNTNGVADSFRASQISCVGFGANLTSVQANLYTAWNNYLTSL